MTDTVTAKLSEETVEDTEEFTRYLVDMIDKLNQAITLLEDRIITLESYH